MQISVVIPLYNKKDSILRALESIYNQTIQPSEIIVVNDGSTDGSELLVEELHHPLIRLIQQQNAGVSAARNKGIEVAKGDWIAFLDADDFWDSDFLETIRILYNKYSDAKVLTTSYRYFCDDLISLPTIKFESKDGYLDNYFKTASYASVPIWTGAICVSKSSLIKVGGFPIGVKNGEDLLTWARLSKISKIAYFSESKSNYYFPINIDANTNFRLPDEFDYVGSEFKKMLSSESKGNRKYLRKYISNWHKMRLHLFAHHAMKAQSFKEFFLCIKYNIWNYKAYFILIFSILPNNLKNIIFRNFQTFK